MNGLVRPSSNREDDLDLLLRHLWVAWFFCPPVGDFGHCYSLLGMTLL